MQVSPAFNLTDGARPRPRSRGTARCCACSRHGWAPAPEFSAHAAAVDPTASNRGASRGRSPARCRSPIFAASMARPRSLVRAVRGRGARLRPRRHSGGAARCRAFREGGRRGRTRRRQRSRRSAAAVDRSPSNHARRSSHVRRVDGATRSRARRQLTGRRRTAVKGAAVVRRAPLLVGLRRLRRAQGTPHSKARRDAHFRGATAAAFPDCEAGYDFCSYLIGPYTVRKGDAERHRELLSAHRSAVSGSMNWSLQGTNSDGWTSCYPVAQKLKRAG